MDLDAFRAPGGQVQGAATKAMPCASSRRPQRRRWPPAAETLWAAAGCVAALRCCGLEVPLWVRLRPRALIRSQTTGGASEPITRTGSWYRLRRQFKLETAKCRVQRYFYFALCILH